MDSEKNEELLAFSGSLGQDDLSALRHRGDEAEIVFLAIFAYVIALALFSVWRTHQCIPVDKRQGLSRESFTKTHAEPIVGCNIGAFDCT